MTANDIRWLLRQKYAPPDYAIAFEVGNTTGLNVKRHADAVAMSLWPSRGLELLGFEIKVSRSDLKKEVETPEKAEPVAKYCDGWYIVCPAELNILDIEVPLNWGIMVAKDGALKVKRSTQPNQHPAPITKGFLAALFRSMCTEDTFRAEKMIEEKRKALEAEFEGRLEQAIGRRREDQARKDRFVDGVIKGLEEAGIRWSDIWWKEGSFVNAVKFALKTGPVLPEENLLRLCSDMETFARNLQACAGQFRDQISKREDQVAA